MRERSVRPMLAVAVTCAVSCVAGCAGVGSVPAGDGSLTDPNIRYVGRWDMSDPTAFRAHWFNSYIRVRFTGATVKARVARASLVEASVDGGWLRSFVAEGPGTIDLAPGGLSKGEHTLFMADVRRSDDFAFQGLELAPGGHTLPTEARPTIEFVGDSISGLHAYGYAWWTPELLDCDHVQVADLGIPLVSRVPPGSVGADVAYFLMCMPRLHADPTPWTFPSEPAIVVVNLGTNDFASGLQPSLDTFAAAYVALLEGMRARYPTAKLVALRPFGGYGEVPIVQAVDRRRAAGDGDVHYVDTTGWLVEADYDSGGVHPTEVGHTKVTGRLVEALRPLLGPRAAGAPSAVWCGPPRRGPAHSPTSRTLP